MRFGRRFALALAPMVAFAQLSVQLDPKSAHVLLYFPQLADGGPPAQKWQTGFIFQNPDGASKASVRLQMYKPDGTPLSLDLGSGERNQHDFEIPVGGTRILQSRVASPVTVTGWALATSSIPVMGTVTFRQIAGEQATLQLSSLPTLPTQAYTSAANRNLGVAIANPSNTASIEVALKVSDAEGRTVATDKVPVLPLHQTIFNVWSKFPSLGDFSGTLTLDTLSRPQDRFVAWTVGEDRGMLFSLPPGELGFPFDHESRIRNTFLRLAATARSNGTLSPSPELRLHNEPGIDIYPEGGSTVHIYLGLSELLGDSPSELAFLIAHAFGHIAQQRIGGRQSSGATADAEADGVALGLLMLAGFDPYGGAGALGKLVSAFEVSGLTTQFDQYSFVAAKTMVNLRLGLVFETLRLTCQASSMRNACAAYKLLFHPGVPTAMPMSVGPIR